MAHTISEIRTAVRAEDKKDLAEAIESLAGDQDWLGGDAEAVLQRPVHMTSNLDIRAFHEAFDDQEIDLERSARIVRMREEQLMAHIEGRLPWRRESRKDWGLHVTLYLSAAFIPCVAYLNQFELAEAAVHRYVARMFGAAMRRVVGAGTKGSLPDKYRSQKGDDDVDDKTDGQSFPIVLPHARQNRIVVNELRQGCRGAMVFVPLGEHRRTPFCQARDRSKPRTDRAVNGQGFP